MRVTIKDVAAEAGVSVSTASKALNGRGNLSTATVKSVLTAAERLGYQPNRAAQLLSLKARTVGVLLPSDPPEIMGLFERGILAAAEQLDKFGIETKYITYRRGAGEFSAALKKLSGADGLIITPDVDGEACAEEVRALKVPMLTLQTGFGDASVCRCVSVDEPAVGKMAAEVLSLMLRKSGAAIPTAIICGWKRLYIHKKNIEGYCSELDSCGLSLADIYETGDDMESACRVTRRLLEEHPSVRGIFVTSYVSPAVCESLERAGRRDVAVVGVDVFPATVEKLRSGALGAVIYQNQELQARRAMDEVVGAIGGTPLAGDIKIKPELVLRTNLGYYL